MKLINTYEAKAKLSELMKRAVQGEDIVIAQAGVPMVRLVPVQASKSTSRLGLDRGAFVVGDDFNDPLLDDELAG